MCPGVLSQKGSAEVLEGGTCGGGGIFSRAGRRVISYGVGLLLCVVISGQAQVLQKCSYARTSNLKVAARHRAWMSRMGGRGGGVRPMIYCQFIDTVFFGVNSFFQNFSESAVGLP